VTYTEAVLVAVAAAVVLDSWVLRTRLLRQRVFWFTYPIVLGFQLVFNGVLAGRGVVRYRAGAVLGWRFAGAPVEDLLFGFALVLTVLAVWVRLERLPRPLRRSGGWLRRRGL
jgi:lycopene cyclase domain-containing protein